MIHSTDNMSRRGFVRPSRFRVLDDLVLRLKGLVEVRSLRERDGADKAELQMFDEEIVRARDALAGWVKQNEGGAAPAA
jgi:hypothetical protein